MLEPGYEGVIEPGYEGFRAGVRGYQCRGMRVLESGYEGVRAGVRGYQGIIAEVVKVAINVLSYPL